MQSSRSAVALLTLALVLASLPWRADAAQAGDSAVVAAVKRALSNNSDLRRLTVTAADGDITLSGRVPTLWLKQDAIKRTLKVQGVKNVLSEMELPRLESDQNLAFYIGQAVDAYRYQTIFDYLDAVILKGVVTLKGAVTGERNKADEIAEQVSRVRGVQDIKNEIVTLPPSQGDDQIRASLYSRLESSIHFQDIITVKNPPFRLTVQNGVITLNGWVQGEVEYRELEQIARFTPGVLRVTNSLRMRTPPKSSK
ncbi:MAG TPA: BON domain-containing protein [Vicinamibacterales bacterium]|jgi:osmotically-inducible protein OsmY|nr:BON domain-containing protein [Vicinamibacterales bacterium]